MPTFFAGVIALVVVALLTPFSHSSGSQEVERDLATLRRGLAQAPPDLERLLPLAEDLLARSQRHPRAAGEIHFLVGTAYMRQADLGPADHARDLRAGRRRTWNRRRPVACRPRTAAVCATAWAACCT